MFKHTTGALSAALVLATGSTAFAFEPISFKEVPSLTGKTVYAATNTSINTDDYVYAGEPLTVIGAEPYNDQSTGPEYNSIDVKSSEGKPGTIQIRFLSKKPLEYNLRKPGRAKDLILKVFKDAYALPKRIHEIRRQFAYNLDSSTNKDLYHQVDSMEESFRFSERLVHNLVYSSNNSKDQLMRDGETKWLAMADDDRLLDWYADGIKDKKLKTKLINAKDALDRLENVSSHGFDIARLEKERSEKSWRDGLDGVPAAKLKKIDGEKLGEIQKEIKRREKMIAEAFTSAAKMKSKLN